MNPLFLGLAFLLGWILGVIWVSQRSEKQEQWQDVLEVLVQQKRRIENLESLAFSQKEARKP